MCGTAHQLSQQHHYWVLLQQHMVITHIQQLHGTQQTRIRAIACVVPTRVGGARTGSAWELLWGAAAPSFPQTSFSSRFTPTTVLLLCMCMV